MKRREQWRPVLEAEIKRWSAVSCAQLTSQSAHLRTYEVEFESKKYQVEVQILENTDSYVHVGVAVDDGHFWRAMHPLSFSLNARGVFDYRLVKPSLSAFCSAVRLWFHE